MPRDAARAIWQVTAGLIPGEPDPTHTRTFNVTSEEWDASASRANGQTILLLERFHQAVAYAAVLHLLCASGLAVNWVRIDFVWP